MTTTATMLAKFFKRVLVTTAGTPSGPGVLLAALRSFFCNTSSPVASNLLFRVLACKYSSIKRLWRQEEKSVYPHFIFLSANMLFLAHFPSYGLRKTTP